MSKVEITVSLTRGEFVKRLERKSTKYEMASALTKLWDIYHDEYASVEEMKRRIWDEVLQPTIW